MELSGTIGDVLCVAQIQPIIRQFAHQGIGGKTGNVIHDGEDTSVSFGTHPYILRHLIPEGRKVAARKVREKTLEENAVEMIIPHPFEMAHYRLLFKGGIKFSRRTV